MEYGDLKREFHVEATPEVVFEVLSSPEHIQEWWGAQTGVAPVAGSSGELVWGNKGADGSMTEQITVVDADPPRLFSFRWVYPAGEVPVTGNSLLVTFELAAAGTGTAVRLTESDFRERGWEAAVLEQAYQQHVDGWALHLGHLSEYAARLVSTR